MTPLPIRREDLPAFLVTALGNGLVEDETTGCWSWRGAHHPRSGTAIVRALMGWLAVPRVAYALVHGTCPALRLRATCAIIRCCSPRHHRLGRAYHPERQPAKRLSPDQLAAVLKLAEAGVGTMATARTLGLDATTVSRVRNGLRYQREVAALRGEQKEGVSRHDA